MARLIWTLQAVEDMEAICNFIARDSPRYAQLFAQRVFSAAERLSLFPSSGRVVPEILQDDIREVLLGNYRVIYRIKREEVQVLAVYHSARLLDPHQFDSEP